ncbi:MAG: YjdF family protein [Eggerthella lenta]
MQISVSSTLTVYHDGQFWVGLAEHVEDGRYGVARIVFGAEPSDEEILRFVTSKWAKLAFFGDDPSEASEPAKNPKRRAREAAKALKRPAVSTKGAAGARESAGDDEAGIGSSKKPASSG